MLKRNGHGDRDERFRSLYQKYYWRIVKFYMRAFRFCQDDAEELAQESFLRFYEAMDEYRGDAEWAFFESIARNVAYNRIRSGNTLKRNAKTVDIDDPEFNHDPPAPEEPDYATRQEAALRHKRLHEAIEELPRGQRQCVQLWLDDFSYVEIGKVLRVSIDSVKSRLRDAKKQLRVRLGDDGTLPEVES